MIDNVRRSGQRVEATLLLSDGRRALARMDASEWDWLDVRNGDIVAVCRLLDMGLSA